MVTHEVGFEVGAVVGQIKSGENKGIWEARSLRGWHQQVAQHARVRVLLGLAGSKVVCVGHGSR